MKKISMLLALVALGGGCEGEPGWEPVGARSEAITNGDRQFFNTAPYSSVVLLDLPDGPCTGTKIWQRRFLTAAHCTDAPTPIVVGTTIKITNDTGGDFDAADTRKVKAIYRHPSWRKPLFDLDRSRDLAIIALEPLAAGQTDPTDDIPTLGLYTGPVAGADTEVVVGQEGKQVGYGCDDPDEDDSGVKREADFVTVSLKVLRDATSLDDDITLGIFTNNSIHDAGATGPRLCGGDSGGPFLVKVGNAWRIAGVANGTATVHSAFSYLPRLSGATEWVRAPGQNDFRDTKWGTFLNANSNLCMNAASTANDSKIGQFFCDGSLFKTDPEYWQLQLIAGTSFKIVNGKSGKCLATLAGANHTVSVVQRTCVANPDITSDQAWSFDFHASGQRRLKNGAGKCVAVPSQNKAPKTTLTAVECSSADPSQGWTYVR